ncbi:MAG TPA: cell division protein [Phenylobacterium sp.]
MSLLDRKVRGFKLVDVVALCLLAVLVLGVYLAKTIAGRERTEISRVERQIAAERGRIRLLEAEVSHLEQPARIGQLSQAYLGMVPTTAKNETTTDGLPEIVVKAAKEKPASAAAPVAAPGAAPIVAVLTAPAPVSDTPLAVETAH